MNHCAIILHTYRLCQYDHKSISHTTSVDSNLLKADSLTSLKTTTVKRGKPERRETSSVCVTDRNSCKSRDLRGCGVSSYESTSRQREIKRPLPLSHVLEPPTELKLIRPTRPPSSSPSPIITQAPRCTRRRGPRPCCDVSHCVLLVDAAFIYTERIVF